MVWIAFNIQSFRHQNPDARNLHLWWSWHRLV